MRKKKTDPEELLAAIAEAVDDGFCPASSLVPRFPKLSHRDLVRLRGQAARRGLLLERRGPDGRVYLALTSEGWRARCNLPASRHSITPSMSIRASSLLLATNHFYPPGAGSSARQLGGQRQVASRGKHEELAVFSVDRLETRHGEQHVAVAARADLALDVIEILDYNLRLLGAVGAKDSHLPHASMVALAPDGAG